jgi:hypothetical protein
MPFRASGFKSARNAASFYGFCRSMKSRPVLFTPIAQVVCPDREQEQVRAVTRPNQLSQIFVRRLAQGNLDNVATGAPPRMPMDRSRYCSGSKNQQLSSVPCLGSLRYDEPNLRHSDLVVLHGQDWLQEKQELNMRQWVCSLYGLEPGRDRNAAINIAHLGWETLGRMRPESLCSEVEGITPLRKRSPCGLLLSFLLFLS